MTESYGNGGEEGDGHAGLGGHGDAGQARHGHGHVLDVREGLSGPLLGGRHGLAHRVLSIVNSAMVGAHGVSASREDALQLRGRARLGLSGRIRGRAPVTRWPPHLPIQGNLLLELMHVLFRSWVRLDVCMCLFMVHVSMYPL